MGLLCLSGIYLFTHYSGETFLYGCLHGIVVMSDKTVNRSHIQSSVIVPEYTTIKVKSKTRDKLQELGSMKDSYDTVIERLIKDHEELEAIKKKD
jgi:hypothetical protein